MSGDHAVHASTTQIEILSRTDIANDRLEVVVRERFDATGSVGNIGVIASMTDANDGVACSPEHTGTPALRLANIVNNSIASTLDSASITDPLGRNLVLALTADAGAFTCRLVGEATAAGNGSTVSGGVGIRGALGAGTVESLVAYPLGR